MQVAIKTRMPDYMEIGDHAIIELSEELILMLDKRIAFVRRNYEEDLTCVKWWDFRPDFTTLIPEDAGMVEDEFENSLEGNGYVVLPEMELSPSECVRIDLSYLLVGIGARSDGKFDCDFHWRVVEKHSDAVLTTYDLHERVIDEWAELIGCTEKLKQVRKLRGVV